jgi:VWFA-related protein
VALLALSSLMGKAPSIIAFASPGPAQAAALTKFSTGGPKPQEAPNRQKENTVNHHNAKNFKIAQRMLLAAATPDAAQTAAAPAPGRLIAMYFNMASLPKDARTSAAAAAQKFIATQMQANDSVAIVSYDAGSVRVMQDFSGDHAVLQSVIDKLDTAQISPEAAGLDASGLAGMPDAVRMLGGVKGPKAFIWFTNGPGAALLASPRIPEIASAATAANVRIYAVDVRGSFNVSPVQIK